MGWGCISKPLKGVGMKKDRMIELLRDVLEFEFEELDLDEDTPKEWAMKKFDISEDEYQEIFSEEKNFGFSYIVEERGRERHEGEFHTIYCACDNLETAIKRYEEFKQRLFEENDFFLKEELDKGNYTEHNLIPTNRQELPCFSIETEWEFYELYVCICENGN